MDHIICRVDGPGSNPMNDMRELNRRNAVLKIRVAEVTAGLNVLLMIVID